MAFFGCIMNPIGIWKMKKRTKKSIFNSKILLHCELCDQFIQTSGRDIQSVDSEESSQVASVGGDDDEGAIGETRFTHFHIQQILSKKP